mmetsp:Transcript_21060/g.66572  ORF Transcript_21060/g.66572 Transcript_21060/m.66572 type:complete len:306 (+) Transcript_21060:1505-2422(+)
MRSDSDHVPAPVPTHFCAATCSLNLTYPRSPGFPVSMSGTRKTSSTSPNDASHSARSSSSGRGSTHTSQSPATGSRDGLCGIANSSTCSATSSGLSRLFQSSPPSSSCFSSSSFQSSFFFQSLFRHHSSPFLSFHQLSSFFHQPSSFFFGHWPSSSSSLCFPSKVTPSMQMASGLPATFWPCRSPQTRFASALVGKVMVARPAEASSSAAAICMLRAECLPLTAPWRKSLRSSGVQRWGKPSSCTWQASSSRGGSALRSDASPPPRFRSVFSAESTRNLLPLSSTSWISRTAFFAVSASAYSQKP